MLEQKELYVYRAGFVDRFNNIKAARREQIFSEDKHVQSGSRIKTQYISCTESPLILGQYMQGSVQKGLNPYAINLKILYENIVRRLSELTDPNIISHEELRLMNSLESFIREDQILQRGQKAKAIRSLRERKEIGRIREYKRDLTLPEEFIPRSEVESLNSAYAKSSAELLFRGALPQCCLKKIDNLSLDILQVACNNTELYNAAFSKLQESNFDLTANVAELLGNPERCKNLDLEEYELNFLKRYYLEGENVLDIIGVGEIDSMHIKHNKSKLKEDSMAIGVAVRNQIVKKIMKDEEISQKIFGRKVEDYELQDIYYSLTKRQDSRGRFDAYDENAQIGLMGIANTIKTNAHTYTSNNYSVCGREIRIRIVKDEDGKDAFILSEATDKDIVTTQDGCKALVPREKKLKAVYSAVNAAKALFNTVVFYKGESDKVKKTIPFFREKHEDDSEGGR